MVAVAFGYDAWNYINEGQLFYNYISGPYGLKTYVWQHSAQATSARDAFLASSFTYYVLVVVVAVAAGLVVYAALQMATGLFASLRGVWRQVGGSQQLRQPAAVTEQLSRLGLRLLSLAGWGMYSLFFFSTLLPFVTLFDQTGMDAIRAWRLVGWLECLAAAATLVIALHIHVLFARLTSLRPRLFFGEQAVLEAEARRAHTTQ